MPRYAENAVKLPDASMLYFSAIDAFIRTGDTQEVNRKDREIVTKILMQALRWDLKELAEACEEFLKRYITRSNMVEMMMEAHKNSWLRLRQSCFNYINDQKIGLRFLARERDRLAFEFLEFNDASLAFFEKVRGHCDRPSLRSRFS